MADDAGRYAVFAYGSNLDLPDLQRWLAARGWGHLSPIAVEVAALVDWRLVWNYRSDARRGGAANVTPAPGATVWGAVLTVDEDLLRALDQKEGHPGRYRRERVPVLRASAESDGAEAWVYVVTEPFLSDERIPPTAAYLEVVVRGARALGLPAEYVDAVAATETRD